MILILIPFGESKSGGSIRFTENGFQQYWIKRSEFDIPIVIPEGEDWDNKFSIQFDEENLEKYGKNYFRIHKVNKAKKL
ncbi:MAG: hypothetical protein KAG14_01120 [Mycoplasmataceae bacterium]|nr:hypothetical protein [Mycoplasmataceae bacterium]